MPQPHWPPALTQPSEDDAELDGRDLIADRLGDEVSWLRQARRYRRGEAGQQPACTGNPFGGR